MGKLRPSASDRRRTSNPHCRTFPTQPPKSRGRPPTSPSSSVGYGGANGNGSHDSADEQHASSPLPKKQLAILAVIALAEQTALNSISPYLPEMTATFPGVDVTKIGLYVGIIASSFALAQFATNYFWGWLSDRVGRKPVVMLGTLLTASLFLAFGFCRRLWQAVLVQLLMGMVNGNQGVISTCLGEITDRSNQSKAFVYLPVIYGLGGITGPALGGLLLVENNPFESGKNPYPYLLPNIFSAAILIVDLVLTGIFLEESLEEAKDLPPLTRRLGNLFSWLWQFIGGARKPIYARLRSRSAGVFRNDGQLDDSDNDSAEDHSETQSLLSLNNVFPHVNTTYLSSREVLNRNTIVLLSTYLVFQLSNISFNSLYPIFGSAKPPTGRNLSPEEIGLSLSFAGLVTIVFQVGIFGKLKDKMGNKITYRFGLLGFVLAMFLMPFVGYRESRPPFGIGSGKVWLWIEIGFVLLIKTVAAVGGLTGALLLITNSAPNHAVLGTLNGLAQTLSAAGRAVGPFVAGGLFSLATQVQPKGEALAWGVFGGIAFIGFLGSFGIRGEELESEDWDEEHGSEEEQEEEEEEDDSAGIRR